MFNALFVLIVFLLQLNKDQLHVIWPLGVKTNITYVEETSEVSDQLQSRGKKAVSMVSHIIYIYMCPIFYVCLVCAPDAPPDALGTRRRVLQFPVLSLNRYLLNFRRKSE